MATEQLAAVLRHIRKLANARPTGEVTDGQLLERFVTQRDTLAFELLVRRHERMVWGVCRRLLANVQDAEDAFQAAFVVLVRKAGSVWKRESVGCWLYQFAYRIALRARAHRARIAARERQLDASAVDPHDDAARVEGRDLRPLLDQELSRLPQKYRTPVVLCYLEGKTYEEAARQLGCPKGTVATRLSRARELLHERLSRRGLGVTVGLIVTGLSEEAASAAVPVTLVASTVRSASLLAVKGTAFSSVVSAQVVTLSEGLLQSMFLTKVKFAMGILLATSVLAAGAGVVVHQSLLAKAGPEKQAAEPKLMAQRPPQAKLEADPTLVRNDRYGDPLPPGALLRLGTLRQRYYGSLRQHRLILPDGITALMSTSDEVRWLERTTGRTTAAWALPKGYTVCALSPDGQLALLGKSDGNRRIKTLQLWDLTNHKEVRAFQGEDFGETIYVVFSADGKLLATNTGTEGRGTIRLVRVWELATGKELWQQPYTVGVEGTFGLEDWQRIDSFGRSCASSAFGFHEQGWQDRRHQRR